MPVGIRAAAAELAVGSALTPKRARAAPTTTVPSRPITNTRAASAAATLLIGIRLRGADVYAPCHGTVGPPRYGCMVRGSGRAAHEGWAQQATAIAQGVSATTVWA